MPIDPQLIPTYTDGSELRLDVQTARRLATYVSNFEAAELAAHRNPDVEPGSLHGPEDDAWQAARTIARILAQHWGASPR